MIEAPARTVTTDVLVLGIHAYAARPAREQLALREHLAAVLAAAIRPIPPANRIVLDTAGGSAVVFLGDPGDAFSTALALQPELSGDGSAPIPPLLAALNRGPVQLADTEQAIGVAGDGIAVAETLAGFAEPGQIVASRAFRDASDRETSFQARGTRTDAAVRAHELFLLFDPSAAPAPCRPSFRRRTLLVAFSAAIVLIAGGFGVREVKKLVAAKRRPGVIRLTVRPVAEVIVDSTYKGMAPPLKTVEVSAGRHTVELKRAGHPSRNVQVDLKPGEEIEIRHTFFDKPRAKSFWERLGL
jgi:hypothetical protein